MHGSAMQASLCAHLLRAPGLLGDLGELRPLCILILIPASGQWVFWGLAWAEEQETRQPGGALDCRRGLPLWA